MYNVRDRVARTKNACDIVRDISRLCKKEWGRRGQVAAVVRTIGLNWTKLFLFFELIQKF